MVDNPLATSFQHIGAEYDRYRPGFPDAAADLLLPEPVTAVLDLGAGTGKFTELLVSRADHVVAVEPSEQMLAVLRDKLPDVEARAGGAERIPAADGEFAAVTVAQAFHWFDREPACAEIRRVLAPGGVVGMVWNRSHPDCAWDIHAARVIHAGYQDDVSVDPGELSGFVFRLRHTVEWTEQLARDNYLARWRTVSSYLVADQERRASLDAALAGILDTHAETVGREVLSLPTQTEVYVYQRA